MNRMQAYLDLFRQERSLLEAGSPKWMNEARDEAAERLSAQGAAEVGEVAEERYKYTDAAAALSQNYGMNLRRVRPGVDCSKRYACNAVHLHGRPLFVVNDVPLPSPLRFGQAAAEEPIATSFCSAERLWPGMLENFYNRAASSESGFKRGYDQVTLLNTMCAQDGVYVHFPAPSTTIVQEDAPVVQVVNVSDANVDLMSVRRMIVVAEAGSRGAILVCDHSEGEQNYLTTEVVEVYLGKGAEVEFCALEETSARTTRFSTLLVEQEAGSRFRYCGVGLNCGISRTRVDLKLRGEGAGAELFGTVIADGKQRVDHNVLVEHLAKDCKSDMLYKYVLGDKSTGAFAGKVFVAEGAQGTVSEQTHANLCVSPSARAFSQPMLEIYADDVKCNHGSTVGKLDETALFYMRQRGIEESEARLLLQHAFVNEVLQKVGIKDLRERLALLVEKRFHGELGRCRGCQV